MTAPAAGRGEPAATVTHMRVCEATDHGAKDALQSAQHLAVGAPAIPPLVATATMPVVAVPGVMTRAVLMPAAAMRMGVANAMAVVAPVVTAAATCVVVVAGLVMAAAVLCMAAVLIVTAVLGTRVAVPAVAVTMRVGRGGTEAKCRSADQRGGEGRLEAAAGGRQVGGEHRGRLRQSMSGDAPTITNVA